MSAGARLAATVRGARLHIFSLLRCSGEAMMQRHVDTMSSTKPRRRRTMMSELLLLLALGLSRHHGVEAAAAADGLMDPADQPKFVEDVPDAMADDFKITLTESVVLIHSYPIEQETGLINPVTNRRLVTPLFGYGTSKQEASCKYCHYGILAIFLRS